MNHFPCPLCGELTWQGDEHRNCRPLRGIQDDALVPPKRSTADTSITYGPHRVTQTWSERYDDREPDEEIE